MNKKSTKWFSRTLNNELCQEATKAVNTNSFITCKQSNLIVQQKNATSPTKKKMPKYGL